MANHLYGYNPTYGGPGAANLSAAYSSRPTNDSYIPESLLSSRYLGASERHSADLSRFSPPPGVSSFLLNPKDVQRYPITDSGGLGMNAANFLSSARLSGVNAAALHLASQGAWPSSDLGAALSPAVANLKRHNEAFYNQTLLGANMPLGQMEGWLPTDSQSKRPRFETVGNLPVYPQRPGEKDCAYYMLTRTCKFGDSCKFDHPIWVPEGGIPDWKEVPIADANTLLPERPGEPDCPYFMKTQKCKFGSNCKFNHPKNPVASLGSLESTGVTSFPERPSEPTCSFYLKTGVCKFGMACKYHHPKDIEIRGSNSDNVNFPMVDGADGLSAMSHVPLTPALMHNSKGLPIRPGEVDCPFYMKTGSCKYGSTCRYNHPGISAAPAVIPGATTPFHLGLLGPAGPIMHPGHTQMDAVNNNLGFGAQPSIYPQRPGQLECDFYMKTGVCKFGERCKFHHPMDRSIPLRQVQDQSVTLTLAGLPRRDGVAVCPFYMKTGTCKFGSACKFDHPPPAEVMALASQGMSVPADEGNE